MRLHWWILLGMVLGTAVGALFQVAFDATPTAGLTAVAEGGAGLTVKTVADGSPAAKAGIGRGDELLVGHWPDGTTRAFVTDADLQTWLEAWEHGQRANIEVQGRGTIAVALVMDPACDRAVWLRPFEGAANIFMALLKMLIVPIILTSIVTGVSGISGGKEFGRLGAKTLGYYLTTSLLAAVVGLTFVNLVQPGVGAELGLPIPESFDISEGRSFSDILERMVPENLFAALTSNGSMLQVIFFAIVFGFFAGRAQEPYRATICGLFEAGFKVMMDVAGMVLKLIPIGVFVLLVKVVGGTGLGVFEPLLTYMAMVAGGLLFHSIIVLPLLLKFVGGISPIAWFRAMSPALMTAFTTSSSSITLPVTLDCVEARGKVSNKITSFVLPLGATINMDGTALYECAGVIFLSQYYASVGDFPLDLGTQIFVVFTALLASIGAAGIPSAGLVMMLAILTALGLPVEGAALLLAIDRPLDMMRTAVNIWSDSCGSAIIARSEGEKEVGMPGPRTAATT